MEIHIFCLLVATALPIITSMDLVEPGDLGSCVGCQCCAQSLITITREEDPIISREMTDDNTVTTGDCAVRTFTCKSMSPNIQAYLFVNGGDQDAGGGVIPGKVPSIDRVIMPVTCNADGSAWLYRVPDTTTDIPITQVECAYFNA